MIALGGIGTVIAVSTVCIFFGVRRGAVVFAGQLFDGQARALFSAMADCLHFEIDEYRGRLGHVARRGAAQSFAWTLAK